MCFFKPKVRKEDKFNGEIGGNLYWEIGFIYIYIYIYISDVRRIKAYILIFLKKFGLMWLRHCTTYWASTFIYLILIN